VGRDWGGTSEFGGAAMNVKIWYPSLFGNTVHILKWHNSGEAENKGWQIKMGIADRSVDGFQPTGIHGMSAALPANSSYEVGFECKLATWDSYTPGTDPGMGYWDLFSIGLIDRRYWDFIRYDPMPSYAVPYQFGGGSWNDGIRQDKKEEKTMTLNANPQAITYLNAVLDTKTLPHADSKYPSWGDCKIKKVKPKNPLGIIRAPD
jgi:hypothetical protein